ncbi:MAG: hypothetical protein AVDCRST_MAG28-154 [uncultured Rubrobacteraceae bacterium]|uniref:Uncharacterized protein n=1 Tax=uncultured Rubrobacteraceae bacterium TaxID=349277 RepID=A0A6J4QAQ0_9ACTN|nr:MAG: hypothetical protein AVDCRST_MAG28-154 [uncultured Rubrobacteraceae bacterium]
MTYGSSTILVFVTGPFLRKGTFPLRSTLLRRSMSPSRSILLGSTILAVSLLLARIAPV